MNLADKVREHVEAIDIMSKQPYGTKQYEVELGKEISDRHAEICRIIELLPKL